MAHVVDRALAVDRLEGAVEDRQVLGLDVRRALDRLPVVDVGEDLLDLRGVIAQLLQGRRNRLVDDLQEALADELLVLDQGDVGLDPGRIAIHHERDRAGRRQDGDLGIPVAVLLAEGERLVEDESGAVLDGSRNAVGRDLVGGVAVLVDDPQERRAVLVVRPERTAVVTGDDARLAIRLAVHDRGQGGGEVTALVGVVGQAT